MMTCKNYQIRQISGANLGVELRGKSARYNSPIAMIRLFDNSGWVGDPAQLYETVEFPPAPPDRPYIFTNTVATMDGKLILGEPGSSAAGLGSAIDRLLMHRLEARADAVVIGSSTLRADQHMNYPPQIGRAHV